MALMHVAGDHALDDRQKNGGFSSRPTLVAGRLLEAAGLLEEHDAEAVEAGVAERLAVLGDVHAEAARAARAGREEDVLLDDLLRRHAVLVAQVMRYFTRLPTVK